MKKKLLLIICLLMTSLFVSPVFARYTDEVVIMLVQEKLNSENYDCCIFHVNSPLCTAV